MNPGWDASSKTAPTNQWTSMFNFQGTIEGNGHTIKGLYCSAAKNASFITNLNGAKLSDVKFENCLFTSTGTNSALFACVKNDSTLENIYADIIVDAAGISAGGLIGWHFTSATNEVPKSTLINCVFAGSVSAARYAGGLIGTTVSYDESTGELKNAYETVLTDCANYGTVRVGNSGLMVGGLVGLLGGKATVTRCYNAGTVAGGTDTKIAAIANIAPATAMPVAIEDTYFATADTLAGITKNEFATAVTLKYDNAAAEAIATATVAELVAKTAFASGTNAWSVVSEKAVPAGVANLIKTHNYTSVVTPPTCAAKGYTTYTCTDAGCDASYVSDYTDMVDHTEGEDWIVDREPTTESAGSRHKECTVCHKTIKTEILKKLTSTETDPVTEEQQTTPTTTPNDASTTDDAKEGGCGSSVAIGSALALTVALSMGAMITRKKED